MSDAESVFDGVLDLTGADESAGKFEAVPAGAYNVQIPVPPEWRATSNPDGSKKLPDQTPYLNIQLAITDDEKNGEKVKNRRVFGKIFVPKDGAIPADKQAYHRGTMLNFLLAVGYTREEISKKGFRLDTDALAKRELVVTVGRSINSLTNDFDNDVKGYKPAGTAVAAGAGQPI
jgi:hypothetical protein